MFHRKGPAIWYQQDGAPAHNTLAVRQYLDAQFPGRWIGRQGPISWPPRSPDLSPLDFALWGWMRHRFYTAGEALRDVPSAQRKLVDILHGMEPAIVRNMTNAFYDRAGYCSAAEGGHFEHLLGGR